MSEEYEWDKSGDASEEQLKLESVMGTLRYEEPLAISIPEPTRARWPLMAAAAIVLLGVGGALWSRMGGNTAKVAENPCAKASSVDSAWDVTILSGTPRCADQPLAALASLPVGSALETDPASRAEIQVADIGRVVLEPNSRLSLRATSATEHRMQLDYGSLHATIEAPPRLFLVQTPAALAVDLGCEYTLEVATTGETHLRVIDGYVSLENGEEAIYVPAGYGSDAFPDVGTSVPFFGDASKELVEATRDLAQSPASTPAFEALLRLSTTPQDTLGLWHLLSRSSDECEAVVKRLRELTEVNPDPMGLGWGTCSDPARKNAWQIVLEPYWEN